MRYVVGFLLNDDKTHVVLVHKQHGPSSVIGNWNGVGGKMEDGEDMYTAMSREFEEETGLYTDPRQWGYLGTLAGPNYQIDFLWGFDFRIGEVQTMEDEPIMVWPIDQLPTPRMSNLDWMLPFIMDKDVSCFGNIQMTRG